MAKLERACIGIIKIPIQQNSNVNSFQINYIFFVSSRRKTDAETRLSIYFKSQISISVTLNH